MSELQQPGGNEQCVQYAMSFTVIQCQPMSSNVIQCHYVQSNVILLGTGSSVFILISSW